MKCNQDCQQGRRCDCEMDMNAMEQWTIWVAGICFTMLVLLGYAIGGFIWGVFA